MTSPLWTPETDDFDAVFTAARGGTPVVALDAPRDYEAWLRSLFPQHVRYPFAAHHREFWDWLWDIELESTPEPFVAIWSRGGAKSTSAELGTCAAGVRGKRRYGLYVRETQDQADKSVANIAALFESGSIERHYPKHGQRATGKFGNSKGWRRERLQTGGGFTIDAIGLDTAARGVKVEENRPDFIVLDDIDGKHDSPATTAKKIATITTTILPAGSENCAVLAIQNLIIPNGVFTQLADGRADFLAERTVSGPHPAVHNLETAWRIDPRTNTRQAIIVSGKPSWKGQDIVSCQRLLHRIGLAAFRKECQHLVKDRAEGVALKFLDQYADLTDDQARDLVKLGQCFAGLDFGAWRFAFTLWAVDRDGIPHRIDEYFSQREELSERAQKIHEMCQKYGVPKGLRIWGDAANPTDIMELNAAFRRGWTDADGVRVTSLLRVNPVAMENKMRNASVERLNDLLTRNAIRFRRSVGADHTWLLGYNAASSGTETNGSRLMWEIENWSYPTPVAGEAQKQDPDDNTADGSDMIASMRYAIMSWWKPAKPAPPPKEETRNRDNRFAGFMERLNDAHNGNAESIV